MGSENEEQFLPDVPLTRFASFEVKAVGTIAAVVTAFSTIYAGFFSPKTDLLQFLAFAAVSLAILTSDWR